MKLKKIKNNPAHWPPEEDVAEMRKLLSSPKVMGSSGLPPKATPVQKLKYELCKQVVIYIQVTKITRKEMAKILKVDEPELSRLLHYKIQRFTLDRLVGYISILYPKFTIEVKAA